jgi:hypothetical protein
MKIRSLVRRLGVYSKASSAIAFGLTAALFLITGPVEAQKPAGQGKNETTPARQNAAQDRDLVDFKLFKGNDPVRVGDILLTLRGVDKNTQRYTIDLYVGAQRHEKKDMYAGEPIYFYVGSDDQPHELLVRIVFDDRIEGRLSSPKAAPASPPPLPTN